MNKELRRKRRKLLNEVGEIDIKNKDGSTNLEALDKLRNLWQQLRDLDKELWKSAKSDELPSDS